MVSWKRIKTNFNVQDIPYDMYCNAMTVLKIDSVYKQGKNSHPQLYVDECKYTNAACWVMMMMMMMDFSRCKKKAKKIFETCLRSQN